MDLPKAISLLHRKMNKELNIRLTEIGLSSAQTRLLKHIYNQGEITQIELCNELGLDKSTVAKTLNRMEESGLIEKKINPEDTRSYLISLTPKAQKIVPKTRAILSQWAKDVTAGMTEAEKELLFKLLEKVSQQAANISKSNNPLKD